MSYQKATFLLILIFLSVNLFAQGPHNRSVEVSAIVQENPPQIDFSWPFDWSEGSYKIYKKDPSETSWGAPIAELPFGALEWSDSDIEVGVAYEYAFFKKEKEYLRDTILVAGGTDATFAIGNIHGHGICCNYGTGFYEVSVCGDVVASGGQFDFLEETTFAVCGESTENQEVIITILPDLFAKNMYWNLTDEQTGGELGASPPVGSINPENPKYGFILTGIKVPEIDGKGGLLLMIDEEYETSLAAEIEELKMDYWLDGYDVYTRVVNRNEEVTAVKAEITDVYETVDNLTTVMLLGNIPVPYSGMIYPDGHIENHEGAWPADCYYGEMDGVWTDETVNVTTAQFDRNHNLPGDGKFDQSILPSPMELQVGRVDLTDLPAFADNDTELTRQYLEKNHAFKTGETEVKRQALIDDNLNVILGAPAASAWRNFSTFFTADSVFAADYFTEMSNDSYLFSYGCGGGSHVSADGVGTTTDFANADLQTVFTMMLGSQFGDWDNPDNFLRAPLAQGLTLTNAWVGNPPYSLHHMAQGQPIGYSLLRSQNSTIEDYNPGPQLAHVSLLGDPTLRLFPVKSPLNFAADSVGQTVQLTWDAPDETDIVGYHIYRTDAVFSTLEKLNDAPVIATNFTDVAPLIGESVYVVKTVKLETSASGSYYTLSLGSADEAFFDVVDNVREIFDFGLVISPNPGSDIFEISYDRNVGNHLFISILNANGKVILEQNITDSKRVDMSEFAKGIYFVKIENEEGFEFRKWIKL